MLFLMMPQKYYIETFGCQMNVHDSEKMAGVLSKEGYLPTNDRWEADIIIYNTCSIREKAEQKFFSELGRIKSLKKRRPHIKIAVAGCIAQLQREGIFRRAPHVDLILGPQNIHRLAGLVGAPSHTTANEENPGIADNDLPVLRNRGGRAWVSIMYGCDNFCSYCIVPYTRGRERSRPSEKILSEIAELGREGFKEITLLGQNVNSYRSDLDFPGLLRKIDSLRSIERIRFVTSHPRDLSDRLVDAIANLGRVCEHLHLPLQSGSDRVLNLMNRGYTSGEYLEKIILLKERITGVSITTDIICGFPGETEEDHGETKKMLKEIEFDGIFAFKYSPRPGTAAASMDGQVMGEVKSRRLSEILELQDTITLKKNGGLSNTVQEVLVEGYSETDLTMLSGRTRGNKIVNFMGDSSLIGSLAMVRITEAKKHSLEGVAS
ncbi:MAG TPA: tRNA (N6-isopentenyl adenosine(37)-C2)-methylthiotransferase MiaB [Thermodesulfovibrionales bacterium]|nr:tRNA (N6-isopentenyl adenosine(37)-C2)-methylthiotransferase MiaB [Thermodesulfovibrionales bacterium]